MEKIGQFWVPDADCRGWRNRRKSIRLFANGRGAHLEDLEEALTLVQDFSVAIDGGANIGSWTRVMMTRFKQVHAFEPAPDTYEALDRNIREWGGADCVHTYPRALSDRYELVRLASCKRWQRTPSRQIVGVGPIPTFRIDDLDLRSLGFLKLDVEGYEERALRGASKTLRHFKPMVMFEDKPHKSSEYGDPRGAHEFLRSLGAAPIARLRRGVDWLYGF